MFWSRFWKRAAVAVAVSVVPLLGLSRPAAGQENAGKHLSIAEIDELHQLIKPHAGESRWMEIEWHPNIWEARQQAAKEGKPLFLWAGSGGAPAAGC